MKKAFDILVLLATIVGYYVTLIGLIAKVWITNNPQDSFREDPLEIWMGIAMVWVLVANAPKLITKKEQDA